MIAGLTKTFSPVQIDKTTGIFSAINSMQYNKPKINLELNSDKGFKKAGTFVSQPKCIINPIKKTVM